MVAGGACLLEETPHGSRLSQYFAGEAKAKTMTASNEEDHTFQLLGDKTCPFSKPKSHIGTWKWTRGAGSPDIFPKCPYGSLFGQLRIDVRA